MLWRQNTAPLWNAPLTDAGDRATRPQIATFDRPKVRELRCIKCNSIAPDEKRCPRCGCTRLR
jgi:hypothetical protein